MNRRALFRRLAAVGTGATATVLAPIGQRAAPVIERAAPAVTKSLSAKRIAEAMSGNPLVRLVGTHPLGAHKFGVGWPDRYFYDNARFAFKNGASWYAEFASHYASTKYYGAVVNVVERGSNVVRTFAVNVPHEVARRGFWQHGWFR